MAYACERLYRCIVGQYETAASRMIVPWMVLGLELGRGAPAVVCARLSCHASRRDQYPLNQVPRGHFYQGICIFFFAVGRYLTVRADKPRDSNFGMGVRAAVRVVFLVCVKRIRRM